MFNGSFPYALGAFGFRQFGFLGWHEGIYSSEPRRPKAR